MFGKTVPIYGDRCLVSRGGSDQGEAVGVRRTEYQGATAWRFGYELFSEVRTLLSVGQPAENAATPALDLHISALRRAILEAGIPVLEIPPAPPGRKFIGCLTHDIDFVFLRQHLLDHTMAGFVYRATLGSLKDWWTGYRPFSRVWRNFLAVLKLPLVHLGICEDFWVPFGKYLKAENGRPSTFFIVPFKDTPGRPVKPGDNRRRATAYDISDLGEWVQKLEKGGCEVALHGLDAWADTESALKEAARIEAFTGVKPSGVRMHWLYFTTGSPEVLDKAGLGYDSTCGYNDAGGYKAGTSQAFRPIGSNNLLELPMHLQDTALFYPDRMHLREAEAWKLCAGVIANADEHGGVVTLLWHDRSLVPERQWGDFYGRLLTEMDKRPVWWATARDVTQWFGVRRSVRFGPVEQADGRMQCSFENNVPDLSPGLVARLSLMDESGRLQIAETEISGQKSAAFSFTSRLAESAVSEQEHTLRSESAALVA